LVTREEAVQMIQQGIAAIRKEEYLLGYVLLTEAYVSADLQGRNPEGLSHYGLAIALMDKKFKTAIDFCRYAIELQFYNAEAYINLARVYDLAGARKKSIETLEKGLEIVPDHRGLRKMRDQYGYRQPRAVPFLDRSNPVNKAIGIARTPPVGEAEE